MTKVAGVYFSGTGTTAASVIEGVAAAGAEVLDARINGEDIVEGQRQNDKLATRLDEFDAIIFSTPTYMGSVSGQLKSFFDAMAPGWFTQKWRDKIAGGFTASSRAAGDKAGAFTAISAFVMQIGMIWVGTGAGFQENLNTNGFYFGPDATASTPEQLTESDLATAKHLGTRVIARLLQNSPKRLLPQPESSNKPVLRFWRLTAYRTPRG